MTQINSGAEKSARLVRRFPDALDPGCETVGITDTGYGEDHCWSAHFTRVVDVNSDAPFSPFVDARSPIEAVHSALLHTNAERRRRDAGTGGLDPRRPSAARRERQAFSRSDLAHRLAAFDAELEGLERDPAANAWPIARLTRDARRALDSSDPPSLLAPAGSLRRPERRVAPAQVERPARPRTARPLLGSSAPP